MAKFFENEKRRKRALTALSALLAASLSVGVFAACTSEPGNNNDDEGDNPPLPTDVQTLKNGNFEFYSEMTEKDQIDKRSLISTPTSWSTPTAAYVSDTKSGLIDTADWNYFAKSGGSAFTSVDDAVARWEDDNVTAYDRLKFYEDFETEIDDLPSTSAAAKLFNEYSYSVDYEDVQYLAEDFPEGVPLHEGVKEDDTGLLMIHNKKSANGVLGAATYFTSSTTITLSAGTAAKLSVWVYTDKLFHYADNGDAADDLPVTARAGAYIGVTHTVGGQSFDQMQIKNINTKGNWVKYDLVIRGNTFASSTFRIVLGLGQGSSENRYENVNGYAFFDDLTCDIVPANEFDKAVEAAGEGKVAKCDLETPAKDKLFDATANPEHTLYALDMLETGSSKQLDVTGATVALTKEVSGKHEWTSENKGFGDYRDPSKEDANIVEATTLTDILGETTNGYLKAAAGDFSREKFPFEDENIVLILSANGAAYTVSLPLTVKAESRLLVSFFVKTSEILSGRTGAGATVTDASDDSELSSLTAFSSRTISTVDIDDDHKDIYDGWVQCFFFVENPLETEKEVKLNFTFGPGSSSIASSTPNSYGQGWAAFANFSTRDLSETEFGYVSTGDRAKKVTLTESVENSSKFDSADASSQVSVKDGPANPSTFKGTLAGSNALVPGGEANALPENVVAGILSDEYAENYKNSTEPWALALSGRANGAADATAWWENIFGDENKTVARQPLVILNTGDTAAKAYGFRASSVTVSANSYQRVSLNVFVTAQTKAYVYLTDASDLKQGYNKQLAPERPVATYWYDDEGNIVNMDPSSDNFEKDGKILFTLEENGLYKNALDKEDTKYYANLSAYEEKDGNLVTSDGTKVFFGKDGVYYAYYEEDGNEYTQPVEPLPTQAEGKDILRFKGLTEAETAKYESKILVDGSDAKYAGKWVNVSFYLHTGAEEKTYRVEVWAGSRDGADGIPAGGQVYFDNYKSEDVSSSYETILTEAEEKLRETDANLVDPNDSESELKPEFALYYAFTFYDSADYIRYDKTTDTEDLGNPWGSYVQSDHEKALIWLFYADPDKDWTSMPSLNYFVNYSVAEQTVTPDELGGDDTSSDNNDNSSGNPDNGTNIWLVLSSASLALVLVFAIGAIVVQRVVKHLRKTGKLKPKPREKKRFVPKDVKTETSEAAPEAPAPAKPEAEAPDENDPYND